MTVKTILTEPNKILRQVSLPVEKISEIMIKQLSSGGNLDASRGMTERTLVYTGTWSSNFQSWKSFKDQKRYLLIKYEIHFQWY